MQYILVAIFVFSLVDHAQAQSMKEHYFYKPELNPISRLQKELEKEQATLKQLYDDYAKATTQERKMEIKAEGKSKKSLVKKMLADVNRLTSTPIAQLEVEELTLKSPIPQPDQSRAFLKSDTLFSRTDFFLKSGRKDADETVYLRKVGERFKLLGVNAKTMSDREGIVSDQDDNVAIVCLNFSQQTLKNSNEMDLICQYAYFVQTASLVDDPEHKPAPRIAPNPVLLIYRLKE